MPLYASTIFLSAFLLFEVQPILGKILLPWFGGSAAVWTVCQLFFQVLLLLGYLYAHELHRWLSPRRQTALHVALLLGSLLLLPAVPDPSWKPSGTGNPTIGILLPLARYVGLPFFLLSTTGPLIQSWYVRRHGASPYRLFALSNFASLLALLSYPVLVEPNVGTLRQATYWSIAYAAFVLVCATVALLSLRGTIAGTIASPATAGLDSGLSAGFNAALNDQSPVEVAIAAPPSRSLKVLWVSLAACASTLLLVITNHLTQDVASIPFLWLLPLTLYLLTFIVAFDRPGWYRRAIFLPLFVVAIVAMSGLHSGVIPKPGMIYLIAIFAAGFFICALVLHGEVARTRPDPRHLTTFYLMIAVGGALGGVLVGLIAPVIFQANHEFELALLASAFLILSVLRRDPTSPLFHGQARPAWLAIYFVSGFLIVVNGASIAIPLHQSHLVARNFYGPLRVIDVHHAGDDQYLYRALVHGRINHGEQRLNPAHASDPVTYYCPPTGVGLALLDEATRGPRRIGVVGLGAGSLATYGRAGDTIRYYEINPLVIDIARNEFSFLARSAATVEVVTGDARLSLEREPDQAFDVLVVDAFSSDAIPVHLLTREAFQLYLRHLRPGGVLAVHISNTALDLAPVVGTAAASLGLEARLVETDGDDSGHPCFQTSWVLVAQSASYFDRPALREAAERIEPAPEFRIWTDDYSNLYSVIAH